MDLEMQPITRRWRAGVSAYTTSSSCGRCSRVSSWSVRRQQVA